MVFSLCENVPDVVEAGVGGDHHDGVVHLNGIHTGGDQDPPAPVDGSDENVEYTGDGNEWTLTVSNLPLYVDGVLQTYSWIETIGDGSEYTMTDLTIDGNTTTITNTYGTDRF